MYKIQRSQFLLNLILLVLLQLAICDSNNQPRITTHDGDLIFHSAQDKNITIRLSGSSKFMINDISVLDSLQKAPTHSSPGGDSMDIAALPSAVQSLKADVRRFTNRLSRVENRSTSLPRARIRTLQTRVRTLVRRVNEIETKLREDDCISNPCQNGGTCFDLYENFHCDCPLAWTGKSCDQDVNECYNLAGTDLGCQNNAACVNVPGSYRCVCTNGFTGFHCRDRGTDCAKSRPGELCGNGACIPANNDRGYDCICESGWKIDINTKSCIVDVNECLESLVPCHTSCINLPGSFMCGACPRGYTGNGIKCRDIDECATNNGGCSTLPTVQCINTEGSYRCGNCPHGWTGDGRYCSPAETNACADNNICHPLAKCEYISDTMVCVCPEGMTGSGYGSAGCRSDSGNPCLGHKCQNGGTCINHGSVYTCICPSGYEQPFCEIKDPCADNPCLNGGTCMREENSSVFRCVCARGATGNLCQVKRNTCGSVIRDSTGDLTYPLDGSGYKSNEACAWVIRTDDNLVLNVTFSRFNVQPDPECGKDWLQINDGKSLATPLIGRFCGSQLPNDGKILSSQNNLFLWFRSDNTTNSDGFSLSWTSALPICGGRLDVDAQGHGVIKSPGYPGKSPPKRDCQWEIVAPIGKRILLRFYEVVMVPSPNCTKDSIIIYDTSEVLETLCETEVPAPKYTSTNMAKIHFHTDAYREDSLFQVHYEVVPGKPGCGGLFTDPVGKLMINFGLANCLFTIQQPPGTKIAIDISNRNIPELHPFVVYLKIFDGKTEDDPVLVESMEMPINLTSSGNFLLIAIKSVNLFDSNEGATFLEMNYKRICGEELRKPNGEKGILMTPHYPQPYYSDLNCLYRIVGPIDTIVHLNITDYDISEYEDGCTDDADYIQIYYTTSSAVPAERRCKDSPMHIVAPSNHLSIGFHSNSNPQKRRGFMAEYFFELNACGGVMLETTGSFQLLDPVHQTNAYCEWIIEAPETHEIALDLLYRRSGTKCTAGEPDLRIFLNGTGTGSKTNGRLVESYCGPEKHVVSILPTNLASIFLKLIPPSLGNAVAYSVQGNYTFRNRSSHCGGNFSIQTGYIQSPGWPNEYYDSAECVWVIHAPLGHKIELVPRNFSLETGSDCDDDYLEIRNGMSNQSPLIGRYCGDKIPPHISSFTNHLYLRFHSDSTFTYPGFDIPFQQTITGCGGSLSSHQGSIASPHYPEISHGPVQCDWKITVSQGSSVDMRITKLGPLVDFCSNGVLTIYDGDDSLASKIPMNCSSSDDNGITVKSSRNSVFVRYNLAEVGAAENQQFYLEYHTNCQKTTDAMEGVIESPNFPEDYPNYLYCEWNIVARKTDTISLTFSHFELESHDFHCSFDVFELVDMKDDEVLQTKKICRHSGDVLTSDGNRLVIKFTSDFSNVGKGFRLEFKRNGCGEYLTRTSGIIASPKYPYSVDVDCEWLIEVSPGKQIILDVFDVNIDTEKDDCSTNGLIVKNDKNNTRNLIRECKVFQVPMTVTSHGSTMFVRFYSDSIRSKKYFKASYRTRSAQCGGILRGNKGEIMSPNYPQNYSENSYCEWMISAESFSSLLFAFEQFDLPVSDKNCSKGFVEVYNGDMKSSRYDRYCSKEQFELGITKGLSTNIMSVIFSSEDGPPAKGFILKYKKVCSTFLDDNSGLMKSNAVDGFCFWTIYPDKKDSKIVITFLHIDCHCDGLNNTECYKTKGVTVQENERPPTLKFCEIPPPDLIMDCKYVRVKTRNTAFMAKYTVIETSCGGDLTSLRGSLASPYYPDSYPSNVECIWTIKASSGNMIELYFDQLDIANSDDCNQDYLEVREKSLNGKLLGVYCSNTKPVEALSIYEQVWIKFRSAEESVGKGFKLSWTYAQMNAITGFGGQIQSPPIQSMRSENEPFQWRITVPRDYIIMLTFTEYNRGLSLYDGFDSEALPIEIELSPWEVMSSTNVILLVSDNKMLDHFKIVWKAVAKSSITKNETLQECNETLNIAYGATVELSSPGYPTGYDMNLQCQWLIKADHATRHAVVALYDVRLETMDGCSADYLIVSSSKNLNDWNEELRICDSAPPSRKPIKEIHGTPYLRMNLVTDATVNRTGFQARVYTTCGGNLTGSIGQILDTDVQTSGNENLIDNCTWHIEVNLGKRIEFTFEFPLNMEKNTSNECSNYAIIRDGINVGAPILPPGRICSYKDFNGTVFTSSNYASVKYYIQPHNPFLPYEQRMWNLTYREFSDCGGEVRLTSYSRSVNISSPNYPNVPNAHTECIWIIVAPPGEAIQAEFVDHFDMNVRQCNREYIEFKDGSTQLAKLLGKYCIRPGTIRSSGNVLYMRYLTNIAEPRNGFKVNVSLSMCGGTFTQFNNVITSANYPAPGGYPPNSICDYVVKVTTFARLNLTFLDLNLPFDRHNLNASDHLRIYQIMKVEGNQVEDELAVIYGNTTTMPSMQIDSNQVLIRFFSFKANTVYRGFKVEYDRIFGACYKDVSGESGLLTLSIAPRYMAMFMMCRWKITVPKGRQVKAQILNTFGEQVGINRSRNFKVTFFNDFSMLSTITTLDVTNMTSSAPVSSTDNKMFIRIFGAYTSTIRRMQISYSSLQISECPDDITADSGSLSVASLVSLPAFYCKSDFTLTGAQTLSFNITRLVVDVVESQRLPDFAVRFRTEPSLDSIRSLKQNVTNENVAIAVTHASLNILQNNAVKIKQFEATFVKHPCGGEYRIGQKFELSLPKLKEGYGSLDCAWHLFSRASQRGYTINSTLIGFTQSCENEYLSVNSGPGPESMEFAKFCRGSALNATGITSQIIYAHYHTSNYSSSSDMLVTLEKASNCGEKLRIERNEKIQFTATDYKNNLECIWELQTIGGFFLRLEFTGRFYIEDSKDCEKDYLEVRKFDHDEWIPLPRYCGRNLPAEINTTAHRVQVIFRSDSSTTADGFTLEVERTCYAVFNVTYQPQLISYPSRWSLSRLRMHCDYILQTNSDNFIQVKFNKFNLGSRNRCSLTKLTAQKGLPGTNVVDLGPYCRDNAITELRAKYYISLTYDAYIETGGYEIEFSLDDCGGNVTQPRWIQSLKNEDGSAYANDMNCVWNIIAPADQIIIIQFKYLVMEELSDCALDYVAIYSGSAATEEQREAKLCGNITVNPPTYHIEGNTALVEAVTDSSVARDGFLARIFFSKKCDERLTLTQANSPVEIDRDLTVAANETLFCSYRIMGTVGFRIEIEFTKIQLNPQNVTCNDDCSGCDYLEILDSLKGGGLTLGKVCSTSQNKLTIRSSYKDAVIRTKIENAGKHQFIAKLSQVESDCDTQSEYVLDGDNSIRISSHTNANGLYSANAHCTWKLSSTRDFDIRFEQFSLQNKSDVTNRCVDYVHIKYTQNYKLSNGGQHCGFTPSYVIHVERFTSKATAEITFHSNEEIESTGFTFIATNRDTCNRTYNSITGVIGGVFNKGESCINDITLPENYTVNILIPSFFLGRSNCSNNYIRVYDMKKNNSQIYESCNEWYSPRKIFTTTNQVRMDILVSSEVNSEIFFYGSRKTLPPGCGGNFELHRGYLSSPKYNEFNNATVCRWNITAPEPNRISLSFDEFNMGAICKFDYLNIIEIASNGDERIARTYCEQNFPQAYTSENSRIAVVSVTGAGFDGTGWALSYQLYSNSFV